jgi:pimeloyl-ACP methyl ester carboxylesterase
LGVGPAVLLLHGLGGNWQNWLGTLPLLAQRHRVIAVDLPGFGASDPLRGGVTVARLADVAIELLDHLDVEAAAFVGNSMGGALTIEAATRHPGRVSDAVLVCSGGVPLTAARYRMVLAPLLLAFNRALRRAALRRKLLAHPGTRRLIASGIVHDAVTVDQRHLAAALAGLGAPGVRSAVRLAVHYDARALAARMRCPTLILWGRDDRILPLWMGEQLRTLIGGADFVVWDDTGHCPMIEQPQRFDELVTAWLADRQGNLRRLADRQRPPRLPTSEA